jgi:GT2 family glycosyltransferase
MPFVGIVKKSIESFMQLNGVNVYVIDNASNDNSIDILKSEFHEKTVSFVKLNINKGYSGAINYYFSEIYVKEPVNKVFVANNDFIVEDSTCFYKMCRILESNHSIASVSAYMLDESRRKISVSGWLLDDLGLLHRANLDQSKLQRREGDILEKVTYNSGAFVGINVGCVQYLPYGLPFPDRGFMYLDDMIFGLKTWELGYKNLVLREVIGVHYGSLSQTPRKKAFYVGRAIAIQKKIIKPCIEIDFPSYFYLPYLASALGLATNLTGTYFNGMRAGLDEYRRNKRYWANYETSIRNSFHLHGIRHILQRVKEYVINDFSI